MAEMTTGTCMYTDDSVRAVGIRGVFIIIQHTHNEPVS